MVDEFITEQVYYIDRLTSRLKLIEGVMNYLKLFTKTDRFLFYLF
jgi:hypothetical protein